jgi:hypothetical protein
MFFVVQAKKLHAASVATLHSDSVIVLGFFHVVWQIQTATTNRKKLLGRNNLPTKCLQINLRKSEKSASKQILRKLLLCFFA